MTHAPDASPPGAPVDGGLGWIDDPDEWAVFSRPSADLGQGVWESSMAVEGMTCAACALTVEDALRAVPGVVSAEVGAASRRARVVWRASQARPPRWHGHAGRSGGALRSARRAG